MDEGEPAVAGDLDGALIGVVEVVAVQLDLATEARHRLNLDVGGGLRHDDHRRDAAALAASATPCAWLPAEAQITPR